MEHPVFVLFALHVFQILCRMGVSSGFLPKIPLTIEVLYATATAILFHLAVVRPHGLKPSYFRFMNKITGNRYADIFLQTPNLLSASYWIFKSFFISWANHYIFLGKVTSHLRKIFSLHFCRVTEINRFLLDHEYQGLSEATKVVRFVPEYDFNQLTSYTQKTWPNICQNNNL